MRSQPVKNVKAAFSTGQAARIAGVPHRTVDHWAAIGLVVPTVADATGPGRTRLYDFNDLVALRVARELRRAGISTQSLREVIGRIREVRNPLAESRVLAIGSTVVWVKKSDEVIDLLKKPGQGVLAFMLDFPRTAREVAEDAQGVRAA